MPIDSSTSSGATLDSEFRQTEACVERLREACEKATKSLSKVGSLTDQPIVRRESTAVQLQKRNVATEALTAKTLKERSKAQQQLLEGFEVLTGSGRQLRDGVDNFLADVLEALAGSSGRSPKSFLGSAVENFLTGQIESIIQSVVDPKLSEIIDIRFSQLNEFESDLAAFQKLKKELEEELSELRGISTGDLETEEKIAALESDLSEIDKFISINEGQIQKTLSQLKVVDEAFQKVGSIIELITGTQLEIGSKATTVVSEELQQAIGEIDSNLTELTETIRTELDLALEDSRAVWMLYRETAVAELCAIKDKAAAVAEEVRDILGDTPGPRLPDSDSNDASPRFSRRSGMAIPLPPPLQEGGGTGRPITSGDGGVAPRRQFGGPVGAGQSFLVGERGPEMFVPGRAGTILPNAGGRGFGPSFGGDLGSQLASVVAALDALRAALEAASEAQGGFRKGLMGIEAATRTLESRLGTLDEAVQERLAPVLDVINTTLPVAQAVVRAFEETTVESVAGAVDALLELTGAEEGLRNLVGVIGQELTTVLSGNLKTWEDWARFAISAIDNVLRAVQQLVGAGGGGGSGGGLGSLFSLFGGAGGGGGGGFLGPLSGGGGGSSFLNIAATRTSIPGGIGGFAAGGNPITGLPALVGERGVELAVPRIPTTIIPNHRLGEVMGGTAITVNNTFIVKGRLTASERAETFAIADEAAKRNVAAFKSGIARGGGDARLVGRRR